MSGIVVGNNGQNSRERHFFEVLWSFRGDIGYSIRFATTDDRRISAGHARPLLAQCRLGTDAAPKLRMNYTCAEGVALAPSRDTVLKTRTLLDIGKYLLAIILLAWVVKANWAPPPKTVVNDEGEKVVVGESRGLGYVWQRHVLDGQPIHTGYLVAGFLIYLASALLTMFRWYLLVRALDLTLTIRDAFRYGMIGVFFNTFLPGAVGGDIIKAAVLARGQSRRTAAVATVIMDRLLALWALVWFVAILGSIFWSTGMLEGPSAAVASTIVTGALITVGVTSALWLIMGLLPDTRAEWFAELLQRLPLVGGPASELWRSAWMYRRRQACIALVLVLSWIGQVGFVVAFYCFANVLWSPELGPIPTLTQHFLLVPIGLVMQAVVPLPGGAGVGEWGFGALYLLFGGAEANGVLGSLVQRVFCWVLGLVGYVVYLWVKPGLAPSNVVTQESSEPAPMPASVG
jgi:uncharacterized membrane protein YbhN (UPF0104 family)